MPACCKASAVALPAGPVPKIKTSKLFDTV
jgi:hypothetical protein